MKLTKDTPIGELSSSRDELMHYGIKGMKWGVRRYQNKDGTLTAKGRERYRDTKSGGLSEYETSLLNMHKTATTLGRKMTSAGKIHSQENDSFFKPVRMHTGYEPIEDFRTQDEIDEFRYDNSTRLNRVKGYADRVLSSIDDAISVSSRTQGRMNPNLFELFEIGDDVRAATNNLLRDMGDETIPGITTRSSVKDVERTFDDLFNDPKFDKLYID